MLGLEPRVRFLGERRDVPCVMRAADIFCQPNEGPEPFGVVFAEALLSGLPVVTTDTGGAREIVSDECGRLVPAGDVDALTRTLGDLIEDAALRARLGRRGPAHAAARCAPAVVLPQLESLAGARPDAQRHDHRYAAAVERGLNSQGESDAPIYRAAAALLRARRARGVLVDVGCGIGRFLEYASDLAADYIGVDVVRHPGLSQDAAFHRADLDRDAIPLPAASADIVAALETIEHLESPRAFCRELVRDAQAWRLAGPEHAESAERAEHPVPDCQRTIRGVPGRGPIRFTARRSCRSISSASPASAGCRRSSSASRVAGRIPLTGAHYPRTLSEMFPQALSDNVVLVARKDA